MTRSESDIQNSIPTEIPYIHFIYHIFIQFEFAEFVFDPIN